MSPDSEQSLTIKKSKVVQKHMYTCTCVLIISFNTLVINLQKKVEVRKYKENKGYWKHTNFNIKAVQRLLKIFVFCTPPEFLIHTSFI